MSKQRVGKIEQILLIGAWVLLFVPHLGMMCAGAQEDTESPGDAALKKSLMDLNQTERDVRDPFWPVGYYPEWWRKPVQDEPVEETKHDAWVEARKLIKVSGMSKMGNSGYFAVINGRTMTAGDVVSVDYEGGQYRWTVANIGKKGVKLTRIDE